MELLLEMKTSLEMNQEMEMEMKTGLEMEMEMNQEMKLQPSLHPQPQPQLPLLQPLYFIKTIAPTLRWKCG